MRKKVFITLVQLVNPYLPFYYLQFFKDDVERAETAAGTKREVEEKNHSVVAVGVSLSLVVGVGLICVIVLRRSGSTW